MSYITLQCKLGD